MATFVPAKKNTAYTFYVGLTSQANSLIMQANPTLAAGDVKVAVDDAGPANVTNIPVVDADFTKRVKVTLTDAEMNGDNITVIFSDAAGDEWCDLQVNIQTVAAQIDDIKTETAAILEDTAEIGADGAGLTALGDARLGNLDATVSSRAAPGAVMGKSPATLAAADVTGNLPAEVKAQDNIDFGALQKASLNDATPAVTVSDKTGFALTSAYDPAKTAAQPGVDGDTLKTLSEQLDAVQSDLDDPGQYKATGFATPTNVTDAQVAVIAALPDVSDLALEATLTAIKGATWSTQTLESLMAAIEERLATTGYTAPDNTGIGDIKAIADKLDTGLVLDGAVYQFTANALELGPALTAQQVWEYVTRELTSAGEGGATAQEVWEYATRALTDKAGFTISGTKTTLDGLQDLSQAGAQAGAAAALTAYDPPTRTEATADKAELAVLVEKIRKAHTNRLVVDPDTGAFVIYDDNGITPLITGTISGTGRSVPVWP